MEYPSRHHHRREGGDEDYPPPPPPFDPSRPHPPPSYYGGGSEPPPPPPPSQVAHVFHEGPPPPDYYHQQPPPPPSYHPHATAVQHVSHESETNPHHHLPHFSHHNTHQPGSELAEKPSVRVFSKAEKNYSLTIRHGKVILAPSDPSDRFQHWIKDEKYSTRVKDEQGYPSFALVNKASGQAMKHSIGATHPVCSSLTS
ncbi:unnamed protein product [Ilex paraguariensis]|uniref:Uncharacterized protein n=1 Tax=Ilex paraguariensis TaxID=185542 RepID=A0ABC8R9W8_9AQUA